jgi:hypothetical protein
MALVSLECADWSADLCVAPWVRALDSPGPPSVPSPILNTAHFSSVLPRTHTSPPSDTYGWVAGGEVVWARLVPLVHWPAVPPTYHLYSRGCTRCCECRHQPLTDGGVVGVVSCL